MSFYTTGRYVYLRRKVKKNEKITVQSFYVAHGQIKSTAYIFGKLAYISDANGIFFVLFTFLSKL